MLHECNSNNVLVQGHTTTESTGGPSEVDNNTVGDNAAHEIQSVVESMQNSCEKCHRTQKEMLALLKNLQAEAQRWRNKYNELKEYTNDQVISDKVERKVIEILQPFFSDQNYLGQKEKCEILAGGGHSICRDS